MPLTQDQLAQQMVAQLRALDPSASAEIGTPERKIIDTVAEQLAGALVNANVVGGNNDLDAKFGSDLDNYVALFGFGRQSGSFSSGFVTFSRPTPSPYNITIPNGTQVQGTSVDSTGSVSSIVFRTTAAVVLASGQLSTTAPIQATVTGSLGNLPSNTITAFANVGSPPLGITAVNNDIPTTNGSDSESDAELKVRFRNTVFRNLSGTEDQYMALAVATQFSTKANVIGPISRYQEYLQVPSVDDASTNSNGFGGGNAGMWTTTPSVIPYAQYIYLTTPYFLSNAATGQDTIFYREDSDFVLNAPPLNAGDTYRDFHLSEIPDPGTTPTNPNITLFNVYTGTDATVQLPRANDVVLLEFSYLSDESRNDVQRNITNCVDVYVNGENPITASAVMPPPRGGINLFTNNAIDKFYIVNFRRFGQPDVSPTAGHIFMGLFWQPTIGLPSQIVIGSYIYLYGTHYWGVEDHTLLGNTVRARNGIEWSVTANGKASGDPDGGPYTGPVITANTATSFTVNGYTYDKNIVDLQAALDNNKQVTTDVLAHSSTIRYFKLDLTVVYISGATTSVVNTAISTAIENFFDGQYFGTTIQLSDLLVLVRNVSGVQNVRWSNDIPESTGLHRVTETDINGNPRTGPIVFDSDFYLRDSQLPSLPTGSISGDTVPGLILRKRAQNTFSFL